MAYNIIICVAHQKKTSGLIMYILYAVVYDIMAPCWGMCVCVRICMYVCVHISTIYKHKNVFPPGVVNIISGDNSAGECLILW